MKIARATLGGLTQTQLALIIGIRWGRTIRKWESGERPIPEAVAMLLNLFLENPVLITMSEKFRPVYMDTGTEVNTHA
jgi:transcriptional regulator with XRE-family HTH domain